MMEAATATSTGNQTGAQSLRIDLCCGGVSGYIKNVALVGYFKSTQIVIL